MHDWFLPALMEKAKTLMMTADWDQALEAAGRLQQQEPNNIEARPAKRGGSHRLSPSVAHLPSWCC